MLKDWPVYKSIIDGKKAFPSSKIKTDKQSSLMINNFCRECEITSKGKKRADNRRRALIQLYDFLEKPLDKINYQDYVEISSAISHSKELTASSKNGLREHIKRFIKFYYDDYMKDFKGLKLLKAENPEPKLTSQSLLTEKDLDALMKVSFNMKQKALISLLWESAGRPEEILKLRWSDIDFNNKVVSFFSGKTKKRRSVPLSFSLDHLKRLKEEMGFEDNDFIFKNSQGKPLSNAGLCMQIDDLGKRAGIKKEIWPYLFRHTRLSLLITKLSPKIYENISGHSLQMGMKTYAHLSIDQATKEMNQNVFEIKPLSKNEREELKKVKEDIKYLIQAMELLVKVARRTDTGKTLSPEETKEFLELKEKWKE